LGMCGRNLVKYGDRLRPTADQLLEQYGSWEKVIEHLGVTSKALNRMAKGPHGKNCTSLLESPLAGCVVYAIKWPMPRSLVSQTGYCSIRVGVSVRIHVDLRLEVQ